MKSRRAFLKLMAAGSAAATLGHAGRAAAADAKGTDAAKAAPAKRSTGWPAAYQAELEKQKKSTADALKAIRDHALPAGSAPAFVFKPLKVKSGHGGRTS